MKKTVILLLMLVSVFTLKAQNFEGTLKMKLEYKGDAAQMMASMSPSEMVFKMKGNNVSVTMKGGMASMLGKMVTNGDISFMVLESQKTVYKDDMTDDLEDDANETNTDQDIEPEIIDLKTSEQIAGYKCDKYEVKFKDKESQEISKYYIWVAKSFKGSFYSPGDKGSSQGKLFNETLGFPFKQEITMTTPMGDITTITVVTEAKKHSVSNSEFEIPAGYKVKSMDEFMGGMGGF